MKVKLPHVPYISQKIAIDLVNSGFVTLKSGLESIASVANDILKDDLIKEKAIDERANELIDERIDEVETMQIDKKNMFWLIKKRLAEDSNFNLTYEDRYMNLSHEILESAWKKDLIDYNVSENKVKNVIYASIENYLKSYEDIEDEVIEKIENYKRKLIPGTEEYELVFEELYKEELRKKGMF